MVEDVYSTIFSSPLAQTALVFVLVFTIVFAVLQKSQILGKDKKQIDALVSLSIALLVISVGYALKIISGLAPFLAVGLVILLVFMLLVGMVGQKELQLGKGWLAFFSAAAFIAVVLAVLLITDAFSYIKGYFGTNSTLLPNLILVVVIGAALWVAFSSGGKSGGDK